MENSSVCVIILNWNGWQDTLECLQSLVYAASTPETIVVVDNGSNDESLSKIIDWGRKNLEKVIVMTIEESKKDFNRKALPDLLVLTSDSNLGFSGGNNPAIAWGLAQKEFDFFWVLNNDTVVLPDSLANMIYCARATTAGIIGATIVHKKGNWDVVQCAGGCRYYPLTTIFKFVLAETELELIKDHPGELRLDYIYGASFFVRRDVFIECGLFNEEYFLFYEEADLCKRAEHKGFALFWCRESIVAHKGGHNTDKRNSADKEKVILKNYHENLSTLLFTRRFYKNMLPFSMFFRFFGKLVFLGIRGEWYLIRPLFEAYKYFLKIKL